MSEALLVPVLPSMPWTLLPLIPLLRPYHWCWLKLVLVPVPISHYSLHLLGHIGLLLAVFRVLGSCQFVLVVLFVVVVVLPPLHSPVLRLHLLVSVGVALRDRFDFVEFRHWNVFFIKSHVASGSAGRLSQSLHASFKSDCTSNDSNAYRMMSPSITGSPSAASVSIAVCSFL